MTSHEEFLRHAAECTSMAKFSRDPHSKAVWSGMAQRWVRCAELAKKQDLFLSQSHRANSHRRPKPGWSH